MAKLISAGRKALTDHIDAARADAVSAKPAFRFDLHIEKSPEKGVIVLGIYGYKMVSPLSLEALQEGAGSGDLEDVFFREVCADPEKRLRTSMVNRLFRIVGEHPGSEARLVSTGLGIERHWSLAEMARRAECQDEAHKLAMDIYTLYAGGYEWNPRTRKVVRLRGRKPFQTPITVKLEKS